jgi:hypothetical protein
MGTDCVETKSKKPSGQRIAIPVEVVDRQTIFALAARIILAALSSCGLLNQSYTGARCVIHGRHSPHELRNPDTSGPILTFASLWI